MRASTLNRVMREISQGALSRAEAAEQLGVSERTVNRLMVERGVSRPPSPVHKAREEAAERRLAKRRAAELVIKGTRSPEDAAESVDASVRTVYRWVKRLRKEQKSKEKREKSY